MKIIKYLGVFLAGFILTYLLIYFFGYKNWLSILITDPLAQYLLLAKIAGLVWLVWYILGYFFWGLIVETEITVDVGCLVDIGAIIVIYIIGQLSLTYLEVIFSSQITYPSDAGHAIAFCLGMLAITGIKEFLNNKIT